MEDPASITPLIAEKQGRIRELSSEVTQLNHELQELRSQREEYIQHLRGLIHTVESLYQDTSIQLNLYQDTSIQLNSIRTLEYIVEHLYQDTRIYLYQVLKMSCIRCRMYATSDYIYCKELIDIHMMQCCG